MRKVILLFTVLLIVSCGKPKEDAPTPVIPVVPPPAITTFVVNGRSITIEGTLKSGAKYTADFAKAQFETALGMIESR